MKRTVTILLLFAILTMALTGCGSSGASGNADYAPAEAAYEEADWDAEEAAPAAVDTESAASGITEAPATGDLAEKIIYSAYAEVETTSFDEAVETVYRLMDRFGAFLENSSVTGSNINDNYYGSRSSRTADFTLRVPKEKYSAMTGALGDVGNVTYLSSSAENITAQYTDTQSRLAAYETEETRLLEILSQAETVEDMIVIEERLSQIRYEKEWLTSQLKNWDNQVDYSTVTIHLQEVRVLTPEPEPEPETYGQKLISGFVSTLKWVGEALKTLFLLFVSALPVLIPLAVIVLVLVLVIRRKQNKNAASRKQAAEDRAKAVEDQRKAWEARQTPEDPGKS